MADGGSGKEILVKRRGFGECRIRIFHPPTAHQPMEARLRPGRWIVNGWRIGQTDLTDCLKSVFRKSVRGVRRRRRNIGTLSEYRDSVRISGLCLHIGTLSSHWKLFRKSVSKKDEDLGNVEFASFIRQPPTNLWKLGSDQVGG